MTVRTEQKNSLAKRENCAYDTGRQALVGQNAGPDFSFVRKWGQCLLALLFLTGVAGSAQATVVDSLPEYMQKWEKLRSYEGRFELLTPGPMAEKVDTITTPVGDLTYHTFYYQPKGDFADNVLYMLSYCDYPEYTLHSDSTELLQEFFATTIESASTAVQGKVVYENDITLNKYPGRLWRINYRDEKAMVKTRAYVVNNRYYAIQTITLKEKSLNLSTDQFLESFRLLE